MKRLAILFAVLAFLSSGQLVMGNRFHRFASRVARVVWQVRRFIHRQVGLLPRYAGSMGLLRN